MEPDRTDFVTRFRAVLPAVTLIVLIDAVLIGVVSWLYVRRVLSIYPVLLVVAVIFVGTSVAMWRVAPRARRSRER